MTVEEQNIAIAEFCGWRDIQYNSHVIPDYLHDLNAIHEAESCLDIGTGNVPGSHYWNYQVALSTVTKAKNQGGPLAIIRATAALRAEALLKTIGRWKE